MDNLSKFLKIGFNLSIFFIALTFLYKMSDEYHRLAGASAKQVLEDKTVYEAYSIKRDYLTSITELTAVFMSDIEYDIEIIVGSKSYMFSNKDHKPEEIGKYYLPNIDYRKSYEYDLNGSIIKIIYEGIIDEHI